MIDLSHSAKKHTVLPDGAIERLLQRVEALLISLEQPDHVQQQITYVAYELRLIPDSESPKNRYRCIVRAARVSLIFIATTAALQQELQWLPEWLRLWHKLEPFTERWNDWHSGERFRPWLHQLPSLPDPIYEQVISLRNPHMRALCAKLLQPQNPTDHARLLHMLRDPSVAVRLEARKTFAHKNLAEPWMVLLPKPPTFPPNTSPEDIDAAHKTLLNAFQHFPAPYASENAPFQPLFDSVTRLPPALQVDVSLSLLTDTSIFYFKDRLTFFINLTIQAGDIGAQRFPSTLLSWLRSTESIYQHVDKITPILCSAPESWRNTFCDALISAFASWPMLTAQITYDHFVSTPFGLFASLWPPSHDPTPLLDLADSLSANNDIPDNRKQSILSTLSKTLQIISPALIPWTRIEHELFSPSSHWSSHTLCDLGHQHAPTPIFQSWIQRAQFPQYADQSGLQSTFQKHLPPPPPPPEQTPEILANLRTNLLTDLQNPTSRAAIFDKSLTPILPVLRDLIHDQLWLPTYKECCKVLGYINSHNRPQCHSAFLTNQALIRVVYKAAIGESLLDPDEDPPDSSTWWQPQKPDLSNPTNTIQPHEWDLYRTLRSQVTERNSDFWFNTLEFIPVVNPLPSDLTLIQEAHQLWLDDRLPIPADHLLLFFLSFYGKRATLPLLPKAWSVALTTHPPHKADDILKLCLILAPHQFLPERFKSNPKLSIPEWMDTPS